MKGQRLLLLSALALGLDSILPEPSPVSYPQLHKTARTVRALAFWLILAGVALACSLSLRAYYTDPRFARYDWRGTIASIGEACV